MVWLCRERKKAKAAELAQQVQLLSTKAANLQTAKVKQAHLRVCLMHSTCSRSDQKLDANCYCCMASSRATV